MLETVFPNAATRDAWAAWASVSAGDKRTARLTRDVKGDETITERRPAARPSGATKSELQKQQGQGKSAAHPGERIINMDGHDEQDNMIENLKSQI